MAIHRYACQFVPADIEAALDQRYLIGPEIAAGGQGAVFKATRTSTQDGTAANDTVALKLHFDRRRHVRVPPEITATENFSHPNLARLIEHGHFEADGRHTRYVAWEFIEGKPLSALLANGRLLETEVLAIGRDVSSAIAEIWSRRVVHGDIKPSNIMLRNSNGYTMDGSMDTAVLIDLGAARYLGQSNIRTLKPIASDERRRGARGPIGTLGYFSPEQFGATKALSCASDIFSLGVVMLECLLGRHPTNHNQTALADGIQASGLASANIGLLYTLDKMLSARPSFRPTPAGLSDHFRKLLEKSEAEFARGVRSAEAAQD